MVNGVVNSMWLIATTQAGLGHDVTLFLHEEPTTRARSLSETTRLKLARSHREVAGAARSPLAKMRQPDVVHFHSVFIPSHATLAVSLRHRHIPYVVTPHGGLSKQVLSRHSALKHLYAASIEKTRIRGASVVTAVHEKEVAEITRFLGHRAPAIRVVSNPIDAALFGTESWAPTPPPFRLVFLGRYDVWHKGLDRLVALAQHLPEVQIRLHGAAPDPDDPDFKQVVRNAPANISINGPVYGTSKIDVLKSAAMYIQLSRWEGQSISLGEALYLGVPVAVSADMNMATDVRDNDLGLVLPDDPARAADDIRRALGDEARRKQSSANAATFARRRYDPEAVAEAYVHVYESVTDRAGSGNATGLADGETGSSK